MLQDCTWPFFALPFLLLFSYQFSSNPLLKALINKLLSIERCILKVFLCSAGALYSQNNFQDFSAVPPYEFLEYRVHSAVGRQMMVPSPTDLHCCCSPACFMSSVSSTTFVLVSLSCCVVYLSLETMEFWLRYKVFGCCSNTDNLQ